MTAASSFRRSPRLSSTIGSVIALVVLMAATALPLASLLVAAVQRQGTVPSGIVLPADPQWSNFADAWNQSNFTQLLLSTAIFVLGVVPAAVLMSTMAGYALSRPTMHGRTIVIVLLLIGLSLPFEAVLTPLYLMIREWGLLNTPFAVILPLIGLFMPFSVFWMRSHFLNVPPELTEAAELDGASSRSIFWRIHMPLAVPAWSSLMLLLTLWTANQFILPLVFIGEPSQRTLAGALTAFQSEHSENQVLICAATILIMLPMALVFLGLQRQFSRALLQGVSR